MIDLIIVSDTLCFSIVPILIGMARAIGRSSDEDQPLISYLLSVKTGQPYSEPEQDSPTNKRSFSTFRPILPRTLSSLILNSESPSPHSPSPTPFDYSEKNRRERSPSPLSVSVRETMGSDNKPEFASFYFNKVGASFTRTRPWGFEIIPEQDHIKFSTSHLQTLVSVVSSLVHRLFFLY